jgi:hypothetical protein
MDAGKQGVPDMDTDSSDVGDQRLPSTENESSRAIRGAAISRMPRAGS